MVGTDRLNVPAIDTSSQSSQGGGGGIRVRVTELVEPVLVL